MKNTSFVQTKLILPALGLFALSGISHAATLLSTDFTGITIDGTNPSQANDILWTGTELSAPTSLTLENVIAVQNDGELMDSGDVSAANGYFGGNTNLSSGNPSTGQWGVTIQLTVGGTALSLEDIGAVPICTVRHSPPVDDGPLVRNGNDARVLCRTAQWA